MELFDNLSNGGDKVILERSVSAKASTSISDPYYALITDDNPWESRGYENSWYQIALFNDSFVLEKYGIKSNPVGNRDFPQSWVLVGSQNGRDWTNLSYIESSGLTQYGLTLNYSVEKQYPLRFFRLTMIGKNTAGDFQFCICRLYFYGQIVFSNILNQYHSIIHLNHFYNTLFAFVLLLAQK